MKAALNGVPSLSILDGWWIEGCAENVTGWAIEDADDEDAEAASLYDKLENSIAPLYANPSAWARMQQHCIAINGTFFNTHRMLGAVLRQRLLSQLAPLARHYWREPALTRPPMLFTARLSLSLGTVAHRRFGQA